MDPRTGKMDPRARNERGETRARADTPNKEKKRPHEEDPYYDGGSTCEYFFDRYIALKLEQVESNFGHLRTTTTMAMLDGNAKLGDGIAEEGGAAALFAIVPAPATGIDAATTKARLTEWGPIAGTVTEQRIMISKEEAAVTHISTPTIEGASGTYHIIMLVSTKSQSGYAKMSEEGKVMLVTCSNANAGSDEIESWVVPLKLAPIESARETAAQMRGSTAVGGLHYGRDTESERREDRGASISNSGSQVHALATRIFDPSTYIGVETAKFRATIPNNRDDIRSFIPAFVDGMDAVHGRQHTCVYVRAEEKFNPTTGTFTDEETGWIRFILTSTGKTSTSSIPNHPIMPRSIVYTAHGLPRILHGSRCPARGSTFVPRTEVQYEPVGVSYCDVCLSVTHPSASGERGKCAPGCVRNNVAEKKRMLEQKQAEARERQRQKMAAETPETEADKASVAAYERVVQASAERGRREVARDHTQRGARGGPAAWRQRSPHTRYAPPPDRSRARESGRCSSRTRWGTWPRRLGAASPPPK